MSQVTAKAIEERAAGDKPSVPRAVAAAAVIGIAAAVMAYKILRSGGSDDDDAG